MNECIRKEHFISLLKSKTKSDIEDILSKLKIADSKLKPLNCDFKWKEIGDSLSNAANIETTSSSIACIIERITNAFDANIELEKIKDNESIILPQSPRRAVEKWFKIPAGDMGKYGNEMSNEERVKLSSLTKVEFYDSGDEQKPTIIIKDFGIGQHPSDFKSTFLKLGSSNKISSPHLHGTYGHGGSSTYRFCDYSIIVSRLNKESLNGKEDIIGWTIIRKDNSMEVYSEKDDKVVQIKKPPIYQYLCLQSGEVPYIKPDDERFFFKEGSWVIHIGYSAKDWQNLSRGLGFRLFRNYLFDPVLPFRLEDLRQGRDSFNRNMFGSRSTLMNNPDVVYSNEAEEYMPDGGLLKIRYWLLFDASDPSKKPLTNYLERENSRKTIILTLNGQRHGTFERSIISKELRLSNIAQCLLVQIETDNLSRGMKSGLFTSNRTDIVDEDGAMELIKEKLKECLDEDEELKEWERRILIQISKTHDDKDTKVVKNMLDQLIHVGILAGIGGSVDAKVPGGIGSTKEYMPQDPPTVLRFITQSDPVEVIRDKPKTITLEINGPDNLFTRRKNRGKLVCDIQRECGFTIHFNGRDLKNGRLPITILPAYNYSETYVSKKLKLQLLSDNLTKPLETEKQIIIVDPPLFTPIDPPTELKILRTSPLKVPIGKSYIIPISMNGPEDILDRPQNQASFQFSCNYSLIKLLRIRKPKIGKMQISIFADEKSKVGDTFEVSCKMTLSNNSILQDKIEGVIVKPTEKNNNIGGMTTVSRPNYKLVTVYKEDWGNHGWDETSVSKFDMTRDDDGKDQLVLYVNAENENIVYEINRRIGKGQQSSSESLRQKYIAYIAYHLYLTYEAENKTLEEEPSEEGSREISEEERQDEYRRVSKTLTLSFRTLGLIPDED